MHLALAITSILSLFLAIWAVQVIRDPRHWRLWWLNLWGVPDLNSTREQRRSRERQMALLAVPLCLLLFSLSASGGWWILAQLRQARNPVPVVEPAPAASKTVP